FRDRAAAAGHEPGAGTEGSVVRATRAGHPEGNRRVVSEPRSHLPQRVQRLAQQAIRPGQVSARADAQGSLRQERARERVLRHPLRHGGLHPGAPPPRVHHARRQRLLRPSRSPGRHLHGQGVAPRLRRDPPRGRRARARRRDRRLPVLSVRISLRWKILLFTALPLVALALGTIWMVDRNISQRVHANLEEDLRRAAAVFEDMLDERAEQLRVPSRVIVRDPRFFSVLTLPGSHNDPAYRNTVAGVARDFNTIAHADLLVVLDEYGKPVASVGSENAPDVQETDFVRKALHGTATSGIVVAQPLHFQGTATPVIAGGRVVGVLVLGASIGQELAAKLRDLTRSQVSFVSAGALSGSTLTAEADRHALVTFLTTPG